MAQEDADATIYIDANNVLESDYRGVGVQWDPSDPTIRDYTDEEWQMITERLDFMKTPLVRSIFQARWYARPSATKPSGIEYYWENQDEQGNNPTWLGQDGQVSNEMKRMYAILDYCQANDIEVIFGEWAKSDQFPLEMTSTTDPKWSEMIVECLDYLINTKGYTCIKYYNFINEPNWDWGIADDEGEDKWSIWAIGVTQLNNKMIEKGLSDQVKIIGPDTTGGDNWIDLVAKNLGHVVDVYDVHKYASYNDVLTGGIEDAVAAKKLTYQTMDPYNGENKQYIMGEAGLTDGKTENDQQPNVRKFIYGVHMSDYTIQTMRGGQAGIIMWDLDDSMHRKDAYDPNSTLKVWGFWNALSEYNEQAIRPWFYPISLMANYFPRGAEIVYTTKSKDRFIRGTAAKIKSQNDKYDISFAVVNNQDEARTVNVVMPAAKEEVTLNVYHYFDGNMKTDEKGFPVVSETVTNIDLAKGYPITMPSRGTVIFTTMGTSEHSAIELDPTAEIPDVGGETEEGDYRFSISDDLGDWSKTFSHSEGWAFDNGNTQYFDGDSTRIKRTWDMEQDVIYRLKDMNDFTARVYYDPNVIAFDNTVKYYTSPDNTTWTEISVTNDSPVNTLDGWYRVNFKPATAIPVGTEYLKILVGPDGDSSNDGNSWTPQLAWINITRNILKDDISDYDTMYAHGSFMFDDSNPHYFHGDTTRIKRSEDSDQSVIYRMEDMGDFKIRIYYEEFIDGKVAFEVSSDGELWETLKVKHGEGELASDIWYGTTFTPDEPIPMDTNYLKVTFIKEGNPWQPQLTDVMIMPARKMEDALYDMSKLYSYSEGWQVDHENADMFEQDTARLKRGSDSTEEVVYNFGNYSDFSAKVYYDPNIGSIDGAVKFYTSKDATWSEITVGHDEAVSSGGGWNRTYFTPSQAIPDGSNFLKVEFIGDGTKEYPWSPQLGEMKVISCVTEDNDPPTIPANLHAVYGATQVELTWDASTDNIELKEYEVFDGDEKIATSTATTVTLNKLEPESQHIYTVKAVDAAGNMSDTSQPLTVKMKSLVSINNVMFTDLEGNEVNNLKHVPFIRAKVEVTNNDVKATQATMILAFYNAKNQLERISFIDKGLGVSETITYHGGFDLPKKTTGGKVKAFIWNNMTDMVPLSHAYEIPHK